MFPEEAIYYFCKPKIQRGLSEEVLREKSKEFNAQGNEVYL